MYKVYNENAKRNIDIETTAGNKQRSILRKNVKPIGN